MKPAHENSDPSLQQQERRNSAEAFCPSSRVARFRSGRTLVGRRVDCLGARPSDIQRSHCHLERAAERPRRKRIFATSWAIRSLMRRTRSHFRLASKRAMEVSSDGQMSIALLRHHRPVRHIARSPCRRHSLSQTRPLIHQEKMTAPHPDPARPVPLAAVSRNQRGRVVQSSRGFYPDQLVRWQGICRQVTSRKFPGMPSPGLNTIFVRCRRVPESRKLRLPLRTNA